jgi:hypothetical protein
MRATLNLYIVCYISKRIVLNSAVGGAKLSPSIYFAFGRHGRQ